MTAFTILTLIAGIASLLFNARLLDQRRKLRDQVSILEQLNEEQGNTILDQRYREERLVGHCEHLVHERNLLRAQLVAYSEPPRFGFVRSGSA